MTDDSFWELLMPETSDRSEEPEDEGEGEGETD